MLNCYAFEKLPTANSPADYGLFVNSILLGIIKAKEVTVNPFSTGVGIPALEFIVFLRPVKSRILWEQMPDRGTRCCEDINKSQPRPLLRQVLCISA